MAIEFAYGEDVIRQVWSAGPKDKYNKPTDVYTDEVVHEVGVDVPELDPSIPVDDKQVLDITIYLPPGYSSSKRDKFVVRGITYKAITDGISVRNPFSGSVFPTPVRVRNVSG